MQEKYKEWVKIWNSTYEQIQRVLPKENIYPLTIHPPATEKEVEQIEKQLGYSLPATFRHTLLHFSKGVDLYWNMYEEIEDMIPEEFEGISSGTIRWGIDDFNLKDLESRAAQMDARGNDYNEYQSAMDIIWRVTGSGNLDDHEKFVKEYEEEWKNRKWYRSSLHNKLQFMSVDNGDIIAFDLLAEGEPAVVYWDHETEEVTYLADSFHTFIDQITSLYCIGNESWQYGPFLTDEGIDAEGEAAEKWRKWFQFFVSRNE
ncbi:SMI1/KNR4 family protein [Shimazuella sp. AN120528]|uniref:SMI1/KNR4 family protein n=1 Tax=Shimazuella soli TaxID=1892854 RepID=UPI001F0D99B5|nr:SMI1/KNR4 family protein [Shimazuella soli]MCH5585559.1 SMI1/KNR4 family protein [Shimazuella soli]